MATHWKKQLADAHHEARKLKNRIVEIEAELKEALEAGRVAQGERDLARVRADAAVAKMAETVGSRPLSDVELFALATVMSLQSTAITPKRRAMISAIATELAQRGILPIAGDE
jgi:hypothetical protein